MGTADLRNRAFAVYDAILGPGGSRGYGRALAKTAEEPCRVSGWGLPCQGQPLTESLPSMLRLQMLLVQESRRRLGIGFWGSFAKPQEA